ncbi:MAG: hypothetical protein AAGA99_21170 [Actinomycetota bacterium]
MTPDETLAQWGGRPVDQVVDVETIPDPTPADHAQPRPWLGRAVAALARCHEHALTAETGTKYRDELLDQHRRGLPLDRIHDALLASVAHDLSWPTMARLRELLRWAVDRDAPPSPHAPVERPEPGTVKAHLAEAREILHDAKRRRIEAEYLDRPDAPPPPPPAPTTGDAA